MIPPMLRLSEVARHLGWTRVDQLLRLARQGAFPEPVRMGREWLVEEDAVKRWMESRRLSRLDRRMTAQTSPADRSHVRVQRGA
jgi:predicted DNA-binding transcriptional regulator AlpA